MPVYVYRNLETGETFEYTQRISEPALTAHPETGQPVKRVIQPVGIAFKGSGFYVNDSRSSSSSSGATSKGPSSSAEATSSGSETKSSNETKSSGDSGSSGSTPSATGSTPAAAAS